MSQLKHQGMTSLTNGSTDLKSNHDKTVMSRPIPRIGPLQIDAMCRYKYNEQMEYQCYVKFYAYMY